MTSVYRVEIDRYRFFETVTDIFKKKFTDIWPAADIRVATDIPKLAYRYFRRYFNKVFWFKFVRIAYNPGL